MKRVSKDFDLILTDTMHHSINETNESVRFASLILLKVLFVLLSVSHTATSLSQINFDFGNPSLPDYVNNDLNMSGYSISNLDFFGDPSQIAGFEGGGGSIGMEQGLILSTHATHHLDESLGIPENFLSYFTPPMTAASAPAGLGPTVEDWLDIMQAVTPIDPLESCAFKLNDLVVLSFDLIAMGDSLLFDLVFASDEYPEFLLPGWETNRNDLFALFISGPGLSGPYFSPAGFPNGSMNLATVETQGPPAGQLPVSVNTTAPVTLPPGFELDPLLGIITGYSQVIELGVEVECGATYHVDFVLADQGCDPTGGTYAFLRCNGDDDEAILVDWQIQECQQESAQLYEGCCYGDLIFHRPVASDISSALEAAISYAGTATNGVDISMGGNPLPTTLSFPPGISEVIWSGIEAADDGLVEGSELLEFNLFNPDACDGDGGANAFFIEIVDEPEPLTIVFSETLVCAGSEGVIEVGVSGGYGNYTYAWCNGSAADSLAMENVDDFLGCQLVVGDTCGLASESWTIPLEVVQMPLIDAGPDAVLCVNDFILEGAILNLSEPQCSADAGVANHCYGDDAFEQLTYCPDSPGDGTFMSLSFVQGSVDVQDEFWVYDGPDISAIPLAGPLSGDLSGLTFEAENAGGCLTIFIITDASNSCQSGGQTPMLFSVDCNNISGYDISWMPSEGLQDSTSLNSPLVVNDLMPLQLTVSLLHEPFCSVVDSVTIQPAFLLDASGMNPTCFDADGFIACEMTPIGGEGPWEIELYESGNLVASETTALDEWQFIDLPAGNFDVVVTNGQCSHEENIVLVAQPEATISLSSDTTICVGGTADLEAIPSILGLGLDWHWSNGVEMTSQSVSPSVTTTYTCYASLTESCATDEQEVTVTVLDSLSFGLMNAANVCVGDSVYIEVVSPAGGLQPYAFEWSSNTFSVNYEQGVQGQFLAPILTTEYCIEISDLCETPDLEKCVEISVPEDLDPAFESNVISGCFPLEVVFEGLTDSPEEIAYAEWDFGDGTFSNDIDSTSHSYLEVGWYPVSYSITTQYGCEFSSIGEDSIRVNPWPIAEFAPDPWEQKLPGNRVDFVNYSLGAVSYIWDFAGLETSNEWEPEFYFPLKGGEYPVQLTAVNEWGCADSVAYFVWLIDSFSFYAPNAFTPDHDGKNDAWRVIGQDVDPDSYHVVIWNRWGQIVYESWDIEEVWLGEFEGGEYFGEDELYHYQIDVRSLSTAEKHELCGTVTILR